jgi:hypothetical protein
MTNNGVIVMPGLDPGIHPSSQKRFLKKMDHRVEPGDDALRGRRNSARIARRANH